MLRRSITLSFLIFICAGPAYAQFTLDWVRHAPGDQVLGLETDGAGNAFVLTRESLYKYSPDGDTAEALGGWVRRGGSALAVDAAGYVYVTDSNYNYGTGANFWTRKFSPTGTLVWQKFYSDPSNGDDVPVAVCVDDQGYVYVLGSSVGGGTAKDFLTIKYTPEGDTAEAKGGWIRRYDYAGQSLDDEAHALAVSSDGSVYVAGRSWVWNDLTESYYFRVPLVRYSSTGDTVGTGWVRPLDASASPLVVGLCVDAAHNAYLAVKDYTSFPPFSSWFSWTTVKVDPSGNVAWTRHTAGDESNDAEPCAMALDPQERPVIAGRIQKTGMLANEYLTVKYDAEGNLAWSHHYTPYAGEFDARPADVIVDPDGWAFVTGRSYSYQNGAEFHYQYLTLRYGPNGGNAPDKLAYKRLAGGPDYAQFVEIDPMGNLYVTGTTCPTYPYCAGRQVTTVRYAPEIVSSVREVGGSHVPVSFALGQNYPNPFNAGTQIQFTLPHGTTARLEVFDLLGRMVKTLANRSFETGTYVAAWDGDCENGSVASSGVYFIRLTTGEFTATRKLVLMK